MKSPGSTEWAEIPQKWACHYGALSRIRDILIKERDERRAALRATRDENLPDIVDAAEGEIELDELLTEIAMEENELGEVEAALARICAGTYGICEDTGKAISRARLRAVPWARCALGAAREREHAQPQC